MTLSGCDASRVIMPVKAGPTRNGSLGRDEGWSAWRMAASVMAPWAIIAARARLVDSSWNAFMASAVIWPEVGSRDSGDGV